MNKVLAFILCIASFNAVAGPEGRGYYYDGNAYLSWNLNVRIAYVVGIADANTARQSGQRCVFVPPGVTTGQLVAVVDRYYRNHPETRHYTAVSSIEVALVQAFKCGDPEGFDRSLQK